MVYGGLITIIKPDPPLPPIPNAPTVKEDAITHTYVGLCATTFKVRHENHKTSMKYQKYKTKTTLSKKSWELKNEGIEHKITFHMIAKAKSYSPQSRMCNLCTKEKYYIIMKPEISSLNFRNELTSKFRHREKYLLSTG